MINNIIKKFKELISQLQMGYPVDLSELKSEILSLDYDFSELSNIDCGCNIHLCKTTDEKAYVYILLLNEIKDKKLVAITYNSDGDQLDVGPISDGYYTLISLEVYKEVNTELLEKFKKIYVSDGKNLYKVTKEGSEIINPLEAYYDKDLQTKSEESFFSICFLKKCFIYLCEELVEDSPEKFIYKKSGDTFKKDFVWITYKILIYLINNCRYKEAQQILEQIEDCNGFCPQDCGCNKN